MLLPPQTTVATFAAHTAIAGLVPATLPLPTRQVKVKKKAEVAAAAIFIMMHLRLQCTPENPVAVLLLRAFR
jgi:hypothetical protein